MARTKLRWRSAVHLILGSLDRMYCLTAPFLPPPISSIASKVVERTRPEQGCAAGRQVLEERTKLPPLPPPPPGRLSGQRCKPGQRCRTGEQQAVAPSQPSRRRGASARAQGAWCLFFLSLALSSALKRREGRRFISRTGGRAALAWAVAVLGVDV